LSKGKKRGWEIGQKTGKLGTKKKKLDHKRVKKYAVKTKNPKKKIKCLRPREKEL